MSSLFSVGFVLLDTPERLLSAPVALRYADLPSGPVLYVASGGEYGITSWTLGTGGPVAAGTVAHAALTGTLGLSDALLIDAATGPKLLTLGRYDGEFGLFPLLSTGGFGTGTALTDGAGEFGRGLAGAAVTIGSNAFFFVSQSGKPGFNGYRLNAADAVIQNGDYADGPDSSLGDVRALHTAFLQGQNFLFAGSGFDAGLASFRVRDGGSLAFADNIAPVDGLAIGAVTDIAALQIGPRAFVFAASAGTDSILSLRISTGGVFNPVDDYLDTGATRIAGVQVLEAFQTAERSFLLAGGGEDGLTLFEVMFRGELVFLETFADTFGTALADITALEVVVTGNVARVFAASGSEHGVTELFIDLFRSGVEIVGSGGNDVLTGTAGDDLIWGDGGADTLSGGTGDDRIVDGRGRDVITGGPGADIFVFMPDGQSDVVNDFEVGIDRIDLSYYPGLYWWGDLEIEARGKGAVIFMTETDIIRLLTPDDTPIELSDLGPDDFIFG